MRPSLSGNFFPHFCIFNTLMLNSGAIISVGVKTRAALTDAKLVRFPPAQTAHAFQISFPLGFGRSSAGKRATVPTPDPIKVRP